MESNLESDLQFKVVSLKDQREMRRQRDAEQIEAGHEFESIEELRCDGGVCSLSWSPKDNAAAA